MGLALFKERRLADRRKLTGLLPGRMVFSATNGDVVCRPVDVSSNGMGIVVTNQKKEIEPGTELLLLLKDRPVRLQVAWGQPDFGKQDLFRYGLVTLDPQDNLEDLFVRTGCLR
jgi:hypothetical protein